MQEKVIKYLISNGSKELKSSSGKYRRFTDPKDKTTFYWVGKNGAVKKGSTVSDSFSISDLIKRVIQNKERKTKNVPTN